MKKGNLDRWTNIPECVNLLMFSQLVNELLFDYSIPSNRVSTLNSHYLCLDALSAIESIEEHGVPEGTLKPIMEELYTSLDKDPVYKNERIPPLQYFVKYSADKYTLSSKVSELTYNDLKKTATALSTCFFRNGQYFEALKEQIKAIVIGNKECEQKDLFRLTKSLLTELMNSGYSLRYIQEVMTSNFWNPGHAVSSPEDINSFFDAFNMQKKEYTVVFIVHRHRMARLVSYVDSLSFSDDLVPRFNSHGEKQFFARINRRKSTNTFLVLSEKALDPFGAAAQARFSIGVESALYRLFDHEYRYDITTAACGVYSDSHFYKIENNIRAVDHTRTMSSKQIAESMSISSKALESVAKRRAYNDLVSIVNAARFHSHSLNSESEENQLLDLWAIFESVLDISNEHTSDRINQVCMYLVPILKRQYMYSLFLQLSADMKHYNEEKYFQIVGDVTTDAAAVQKIAEFVILDTMESARLEYLQDCGDFPLLKERIEYYSSSLRTTMQVYNFIEKHGDRVRWQVMRIYRNRNLIIHNAQTMPYLDLLIENLHAYVDDFLSYSIHSLSQEHDIDSMCQELFIQECQWRAQFQKNKQSMDEALIKQMLAL